MKTNNYLKNRIKKNHMSEINYNMKITIYKSGLVESTNFNYNSSNSDLSKNLKLTGDFKKKLKLNKFNWVEVILDTNTNKCTATIKQDSKYMGDYITWELDTETTDTIISMIETLTKETIDILDKYGINEYFWYLPKDRGFIGRINNKGEKSYVAKIGEKLYTNVEDYKTYHRGSIFGGEGFDKSLQFIDIKINGEWLQFRGNKIYRKGDFRLQAMEMVGKEFKDYFLHCGDWDKYHLYKKNGRKIELIGSFGSVIARHERIRLYDYEQKDAIRLGKTHQEEAEINLDGIFKYTKRTKLK